MLLGSVEALAVQERGATEARLKLAAARYTAPDPCCATHVACRDDTGAPVEGPDGVTQTSIRLRWRPPVMQGGLRVTDYEISYRTSWRTTRGKTVTRHWSDFVTVTTSWWAQRHPVAHHGFTLTGLQAGMEYTDLSVRARNAAGLSAPSLCAPGSVTTLPVSPPSRPLNFICAAIASSTATFRWSPPFSDGGARVYVHHAFECAESLATTKLATAFVVFQDKRDDQGRLSSARCVQAEPEQLLETIRALLLKEARQATVKIDLVSGVQEISAAHTSPNEQGYTN